MIKSNIILWLCPLLFFFLSFPSISETNANTELAFDQLYKTIPFGKDYNKIYNNLNNRVNEVLDMVTSPEKRSQLLELLEQRLENVLPKSITDVFNQVKGMMVANFAFSAVETGIMIYTLSTTCDAIKESEQFRESPRLQQKAAEIIEHLNKAEKFRGAADNEINEIGMGSDISVKENILERIALNLDRAQLECERAQEVLKNILNEIHQKKEKLSSAKKSNIDGFFPSLMRLAYTIYEFATKPMSILTTPVKLFFATNVCFQTANTVGYSTGLYWTRDEIQKLEEHQHKLDILAMKMKDSFDEINHGMKTLEKIKQYIRTSPDLTLNDKD